MGQDLLVLADGVQLKGCPNRSYLVHVDEACIVEMIL